MGRERRIPRKFQTAGVAIQSEPMVTRSGGLPEPSITTEEFIAQVVEADQVENFRWGNTLFLEGFAEDDAGQPFDLTGCKLWHTAKHDLADDDLDAVYQKTSEVGEGITILDAPNGHYQIHVEPEDTAFLLTEMMLVWDVQARTNEGHIYTLTEGVLQGKPRITRATA